MQLMWGHDFEKEIAGLDILGVRGLDQNLEAALVNGITTISQRARYFTILPWAIGEFFADETASGSTSFDEDRFRRYLGRVEHLVMATTVTDLTEGDPSAVLGARNYAADLNALRAGRDIAFPTDRTGAMLGTYLGPCRALGILADAPPGSPLPVLLTPRGQQIWQARNGAMRDINAAKVALRDLDQLNRKRPPGAVHSTGLKFQGMSASISLLGHRLAIRTSEARRR